jgi:hypothetical protein
VCSLKPVKVSQAAKGFDEALNPLIVQNTPEVKEPKAQELSGMFN